MSTWVYVSRDQLKCHAGQACAGELALGVMGHVAQMQAVMQPFDVYSVRPLDQKFGKQIRV